MAQIGQLFLRRIVGYSFSHREASSALKPGQEAFAALQLFLSLHSAVVRERNVSLGYAFVFFFFVTCWRPSRITGGSNCVNREAQSEPVIRIPIGRGGLTTYPLPCRPIHVGWQVTATAAVRRAWPLHQFLPGCDANLPAYNLRTLAIDVEGRRAKVVANSPVPVGSDVNIPDPHACFDNYKREVIAHAFPCHKRKGTS